VLEGGELQVGRVEGAGMDYPVLGRESKGYLGEDIHVAGMASADILAWSRGLVDKGNCGMVGVVATDREEGRDWSKVGAESKSD